jgi:hypothetical protein
MTSQEGSRDGPASWQVPDRKEGLETQRHTSLQLHSYEGFCDDVTLRPEWGAQPMPLK